MNFISIATFLILSLLILIVINYFIFKVISKNKNYNLITILSSATISAVIATLALDTFDLLFRIIAGFIKSGGTLPKGLVMSIKLHYIFEMWLEGVALLFLIIIVISLITTLIISKTQVHKN